MSTREPSPDPGQFQEQGGASTMDPGPLRRWVTSRIMTSMANESALARKRRKFAAKRRGAHPEVLYFHQVDDGYSHLTAQLLESLQRRYAITLRCYLVPVAAGDNLPEPLLLPSLSRYDAGLIAPHFGLSFPAGAPAPSAETLAQAQAILAAQSDGDFLSLAGTVGEALWTNDGAALARLVETHGAASAGETALALERGAARRAELGHYSGAMFYCEGEWYWGVDRLHYLEQRLADEGLDRDASAPLLAPRLAEAPPALKDDGRLTLEIYPSLRSPYTAIVFDRAVAYARECGVRLDVRPVLPMVMRGVPATMEKGRYIFSDAAREARSAGVPFGRIYDPIGNPVRRAYSLYPWAAGKGKGTDLLSSFLRAAFAESIHTNRPAGLRKVVERAGLDWETAQQHLGDPAWESMVEENRLRMYDAGLWGVPSFRVLDEAGEATLSIWGQDRLWLVDREIQRLLAARERPAP